MLKDNSEAFWLSSIRVDFFKKNADFKKNIFKDGNGEIDQSEMEEVFSKLCRIVNCEQQEVKIHLFAFDILFFFFLFFIDLLLISGGGCESRRLE